MRHLNLIFYLVLALLFVYSLIGLNYNTPFNDEAIYIVIGRLGLFAGDWFTYGAGFWMAGFPYIYPVMTALAYQTGGILGSRLLNVIFALLAAEEIYRLTRQLKLFDKRTNQLAGIISMIILGFSASGLYVAALATYDMPSFFFLLLAVNSFLKAASFNHGKYYFLSALSLFASFLTKIVAAVFYPPLLLLSYLIIRSRDFTHRSYYLKYFIFPLGLFLGLYTLFFHQYLFTFVFTHADQGTSGTSLDILRIIWDTTSPAIILSLLSLPVFILTRKTKIALLLLSLSVIIPVFHLALNRVPTLDKHLYLSVVFLSLIIGYAAGWLATRPRLGILFKFTIPVVLSFYFLLSRSVTHRLQHAWEDTASISRYLASRITPQDRVLTEDGAAIVLSLYDTLYPPTHVATFDWIDYSGIQGPEGYAQAIRDRYFDYIELDNQHNNSQLRDLVHYHLTANYSLIHQEGDFQVYAKVD